jgi:hypothetical protein
MRSRKSRDHKPSAQTKKCGLVFGTADNTAILNMEAFQARLLSGFMFPFETSIQNIDPAAIREKSHDRDCYCCQRRTVSLQTARTKKTDGFSACLAWWVRSLAASRTTFGSHACWSYYYRYRHPTLLPSM